MSRSVEDSKLVHVLSQLYIIRDRFGLCHGTNVRNGGWISTRVKWSARGSNGSSSFLTHGSYLVRLVVLSLQAYVAKDYPQADMSA